MEPVVGSISSANTEPEASGGHVVDDGQIVVIRPQVVETVGHVLGNMFQRMYHLVERARESDVVTAADLEGSTRRLEGFLQLFMDYVSPLSLSLQSVSASDVAQSLAQQLGDALSCAVKIDARVPLEGRLMVDAGRLARAFGLLRLQVRSEAARGDAIQIKVTARIGGRSLTLVVVLPSNYVSGRSSESEIQWSVAEKLLEVHGGVLRQGSTASGEVLWQIMLPLQS